MGVNNSLLTAVRCGRLEKAREFIDTYGLSYSKHWGNGYDLLILALENKHADVAELLLSKGSEVNSKSRAIKPHGTPLHFAASNGDIKIVEMILNKNARIDAKDEHGITPLVAAIKDKASESVELLLKYGADVNIIDNLNRSPLHHAIGGRNRKGDVEICRLLLTKGADVNVKLQNGCTPLHLAVGKREHEIITMLLEKRADLNAKSTEYGAECTPLHLAVYDGCQETILILLRNGADVNAKGNYGTTPLHLAAIENFSNYDIIETLLEFEADINSRNEGSKSAHNFAWENRDVKMLEILLEHGCNIHDVNCTFLVNSFCQHGDYYLCEPAFKVEKLLLSHIVKMIAANLYVSEQHLEVDTITNRMSDFYFLCQEQIANMKIEKFNNANISFYDILTKTTNFLAIYMRNKNVVQVLKSHGYETKFPLYASMIKRKYRKSTERKELLEQGNESFYFLVNNCADLPFECTEKIFSYLSNKDIRIFIEAFKPLSIR